MSKHRLLWADDDPKDRFVYEHRILERDGWTVDWAESPVKAITLLGQHRYHALVLDQMMRDGEAATDLVIWGGCRVLYWVRGNASTPWPGHVPVWGNAGGVVEENRLVPTVLVSAFHDELVLQATRKASLLDERIQRLDKPLALDALRSFLRGALGQSG